MDLRDALIAQSPSLELLRAAHSEICRLDALLAQAAAYLRDPYRYSEEEVKSFLAKLN